MRVGWREGKGEGEWRLEAYIIVSTIKIKRKTIDLTNVFLCNLGTQVRLSRHTCFSQSISRKQMARSDYSNSRRI